MRQRAPANRRNGAVVDEHDSAARVIACLMDEAAACKGTELATVWRELATLVGRKWPQDHHRQPR